jgi:hypothetical protein
MVGRINNLIVHMENIETVQIAEKKRGGCITAFLIFMFIVNPVLSLYYIAAGEIVKQSLPTMPDLAIPALAILGLINFGLAIAMWNWKKIGLYGFWVSSIIILGINLSAGISLLQSLLGLLGPIIITLLVKPKWNEFE